MNTAWFISKQHHFSQESDNPLLLILHFLTSHWNVLSTNLWSLNTCLLSVRNTHKSAGFQMTASHSQPWYCSSLYALGFPVSFHLHMPLVMFSSLWNSCCFKEADSNAARSWSWPQRQPDTDKEKTLIHKRKGCKRWNFHFDDLTFEINTIFSLAVGNRSERGATTCSHP